MRRILLLTAAALLISTSAMAQAVYDQFKLGQQAADAKKNGEAIQIFTQVIDSKKLTGEWLAYAFYYRGQAQRREQVWDKALADLDQAGALAPNFPGTWFEKGLAYHGQKQYDAAIKAFDEAIKLKPDDADYYLARCSSRSWKNDNDGVIADCGKAIDMKPSLTLAYSIKGRAHEDLRQCNAAEAAYKKLAELDPGNKAAKEGLAYIKELRASKTDPKCGKG
ncbi:MAG: tetratricopeptide repeat protein [Alphaproteobacteria bacterium]|nr:tetratricopeptide repeat protein [Alphaproteobacteria bacterium]